MEKMGFESGVEVRRSNVDSAFSFFAVIVLLIIDLQPAPAYYHCTLIVFRHFCALLPIRQNYVESQ